MGGVPCIALISASCRYLRNFTLFFIETIFLNYLGRKEAAAFGAVPSLITLVKHKDTRGKSFLKYIIFVLRASHKYSHEGYEINTQLTTFSLISAIYNKL